VHPRDCVLGILSFFKVEVVVLTVDLVAEVVFGEVVGFTLLLSKSLKLHNIRSLIHLSLKWTIRASQSCCVFLKSSVLSIEINLNLLILPSKPIDFFNSNSDDLRF